MHCRAKEHLSKFNSKKDHIRKESAFIKHLENTHGGRDQEKEFSPYFEIEILKAYSKAFTKCVEEGTLIGSHKGKVLNSKSEWHQAKVIRTTITVIQGGAEVLEQEEGVEGQVAGQAARQGAGQGAGQPAGQGARQPAGQGAGLGAPTSREPQMTRRSRG